MKKYLVYLLLLFIPFTVFASEYKVDDATVSLNDDAWMVFTRDNLKDNENLKKLGISEEYVMHTLISQSAYLDAITFDQDINILEFFVFIKEVPVNKNLHTFTEEELEGSKNSLIDKYSTTLSVDKSKVNIELHSLNNYSYFTIKYSQQGLQVKDFFTVINGKAYTFKFQKAQGLYEYEDKMEDLIKNVKFEYNKDFEPASSEEETTEEEQLTVTMSVAAIIVCVVISLGSIIVAVVLIIRHQKNKNKVNI